MLYPIGKHVFWSNKYYVPIGTCVCASIFPDPNPPAPRHRPFFPWMRKDARLGAVVFLVIAVSLGTTALSCPEHPSFVFFFCEHANFLRTREQRDVWKCGVRHGLFAAINCKRPVNISFFPPVLPVLVQNYEAEAKPREYGSLGAQQQQRKM